MPLLFSPNELRRSEQQLRALGCSDVRTLAGIDANEVEVELRYDRGAAVLEICGTVAREERR